MLLFVVSSKADYNSDLKDFISKMTDKFDTINSIKNKDKWTTEAYKYANEILDIKWMSNFILGKYRKTLTKEQIEYLAEHKEMPKEEPSFENYSMTELRMMAKEKGIKGYTKMTKEEIIEELKKD